MKKKIYVLLGIWILEEERPQNMGRVLYLLTPIPLIQKVQLRIVGVQTFIELVDLRLRQLVDEVGEAEGLHALDKYACDIIRQSWTILEPNALQVLVALVCHVKSIFIIVVPIRYWRWQLSAKTVDYSDLQN